jgi:hypothetical protein
MQFTSSSLVPKLCLGTQVAKLRFAAASGVGCEDAKQSFAAVRSQAELGNEGEMQFTSS